MFMSNKILAKWGLWVETCFQDILTNDSFIVETSIIYKR